MNYYNTYDIEALLFAIMTITKHSFMRISTFVIMDIIRIMVINYFRSYRLTKAEYCVGYWFYQAESICTYKGQVLEQKYCESSRVCVPPFWLTPLQHRRQVPSLTPRRSATRTILTSTFGPKFISAKHCWKNRAKSAQHMQSRR